jgi:hypothetical protein
MSRVYVEKEMWEDPDLQEFVKREIVATYGEAALLDMVLYEEKDLCEIFGKHDWYDKHTGNWKCKRCGKRRRRRRRWVPRPKKEE